MWVLYFTGRVSVMLVVPRCWYCKSSILQVPKHIQKCQPDQCVSCCEEGRILELPPTEELAQGWTSAGPSPSQPPALYKWKREGSTCEKAGAEAKTGQRTSRSWKPGPQVACLNPRCFGWHALHRVPSIALPNTQNFQAEAGQGGITGGPLCHLSKSTARLDNNDSW